MDESVDDASCIELIRRGGKKAQQGMSVLYQRYAPLLIGYLMKNFGFTHEEAEDVIQDAFVNIVRYLSTTRQETEVREVGPWIWRITINRAKDILRSPERRRRVEEDVVERERAAPQEDTPDAGLVDCVRRAFRAFAADHPTRAEALRLAILEEWTMQELTTYLERSYGATREYVSQCRKALRPYLEHCRDYLQPSEVR